MEKDRYLTLDGLRAYASLGIVLMHVMTNGMYSLGAPCETVIKSFTDFVFLFMMVSSFSICCGYYEKTLKGELKPDEFYGHRFKKILPFFALLTLIDVAMSPSVSSLYEAFANLTLCFGLLPNPDINVIGVGWFLGVVFVFYIIFPFLCSLMSSKRRAWLTFFAAFAFNILCTAYFFDADHVASGFRDRANIMYCAVYFTAGMLIYLYRNKLVFSKLRQRLVSLASIAVTTLTYYAFGSNVITTLAVFSAILIYAVGAPKSHVLQNRLTAFLSKISMEIYLCHMLFFRLLEKLSLTKPFGNDALSYIAVTIAVIIGAVIFSTTVKKGFEYAEKKIKLLSK